MYVPGHLEDSSQFLIAVGTGYFVEMVINLPSMFVAVGSQMLCVNPFTEQEGL